MPASRPKLRNPVPEHPASRELSQFLFALKAQPTVVDKLAASPGFKALSGREQSALSALAKELPPQAQMNLVQLCSQMRGTEPSILSPDFAGGRMIDHIIAMGGHPRSRDALMGSIHSLANPTTVDEGFDRAVSVAGCIASILAMHCPGEYARIVQGLTKDGAVALTSGERLEVPADGFEPDESMRSPDVRIIESALMELGNGWGSYSNQTDVSTYDFGLFTTTARGTEMDDAADLMSSVFGRKFVGESNPRRAFEALEARTGQDTIVALAWGPERKSTHGVVFEKIDGDRVYFRNSWGAYGATGATRSDPLRHQDDASRGLESMTIQDFKKALRGAILPK